MAFCFVLHRFESNCSHVVSFLCLCCLKIRSGPESFVAEVAGDDDSFEVVCFNVIFYDTAMAFFSTNFAAVS